MKGMKRDADTGDGYVDMGRRVGINWGVEIDVCARTYFVQLCLTLQPHGL